VRIVKDGGCPLRNDLGCVVDGQQMRTLKVDMRVDEARTDVLPAHVQHMRCVLARPCGVNTSDHLADDADICRPKFTRHHIHQRAPCEHQVEGAFSLGGFARPQPCCLADLAYPMHRMLIQSWGTTATRRSAPLEVLRIPFKEQDTGTIGSKSAKATPLRMGTI